MKKKVFCKKYDLELEALGTPPLPGEKGIYIYENFSQKAWSEWLAHQTMLINENKLNLSDKNSRKWLNQQMELFLKNEDYIVPEGFKPKD